MAETGTMEEEIATVTSMVEVVVIDTAAVEGIAMAAAVETRDSSPAAITLAEATSAPTTT